MKPRQILLTAAIVSGLMLSQTSFAHEGEDHAGDTATRHEDTMNPAPTPMSAEEALVSIQSSVKKIGEMVNSGNVDKLHEEIEKVNVGIKAMSEKTSATGDPESRLDSALKQLSAQLKKVHAASDSKDVAKTASELKKAEGALKLVEASMQ